MAEAMQTDGPTRDPTSSKSEHVKRLHQVTEGILANILGEVSDSPSFAPFDTLESVRYNADQDIKDLVDAHNHFDQFFARKRLVYTQQHPEKVLEWYIAEMKKAVARKDLLIRRHHQNLARWSTVLKNEPSPANPPEERPIPTPQPADTPSKRQDPQRPPPSLSAAPQPSPAAPTFPPQPTLYASSAPSPQSYVPPGAQMYRPPGPQHRQPSPGFVNRAQMPPGGFQSGFAGQPSSLSAILQSGPSSNPMLQQARPMRSQSPSVPSPGAYGAVPSPRVQWRPPGVGAMGYSTEEQGGGDMGYHQPGPNIMPGSGPHMPPQL